MTTSMSRQMELSRGHFKGGDGKSFPPAGRGLARDRPNPAGMRLPVHGFGGRPGMRKGRMMQYAGFGPGPDSG